MLMVFGSYLLGHSASLDIHWHQLEVPSTIFKATCQLHNNPDNVAKIHDTMERYPDCFTSELRATVIFCVCSLFIVQRFSWALVIIPMEATRYADSDLLEGFLPLASCLCNSFLLRNQDLLMMLIVCKPPPGRLNSANRT